MPVPFRKKRFLEITIAAFLSGGSSNLSWAELAKADVLQKTNAGENQSQDKLQKMAVVESTASEQSDQSSQQMQLALQLKNDLVLLNSLEVRGWDSQSATGVLASKNSLLQEDGHAAEEAGEKPSAILLEFGCIDVASKSFRRGQRVCKIHLYRFQSSDGAYGAYSTMREGSSTVVVRGQASSEDQDSITFYSGPCMVFLNSTVEGDEEAKQCLGKLADQLAPRLPANAPPPKVIVSLPHFDRLNGSEKYFMGSQAARHYANLPFLEALQLDQSKNIAYADYQYSRPIAERLKLLVAEFKNPADAQAAYSSFVATMTSYCRKKLEESNSETLCKMSDSYLMCGTSRTKVYVVAGARKASSPLILARELRNL